MHNQHPGACGASRLLGPIAVVAVSTAGFYVVNNVLTRRSPAFIYTSGIWLVQRPDECWPSFGTVSTITLPADGGTQPVTQAQNRTADRIRSIPPPGRWPGRSFVDSTVNPVLFRGPTQVSSKSFHPFPATSPVRQRTPIGAAEGLCDIPPMTSRLSCPTMFASL